RWPGTPSPRSSWWRWRGSGPTWRRTRAPGGRWRRPGGWWRWRRGCSASGRSTSRRASTGARGDAMMEFYPQIKAVHVGAVMASGLLFGLRGLLVVAGRPGWALAAPVRWLSVAIDTTLLTAALMLLTLLPGAMFANGWLAAKLVLLVGYVVLGSIALRRGRTPRARLACYLAALVVFASIYGIARAH